MDAAPPTVACLNCGVALSGRWCSQCGQRAVAARPTLRELLHEAIHEFAHLDGKLFRTAKLLLFKPGALTREFLDGKARAVGDADPHLPALKPPHPRLLWRAERMVVPHFYFSVHYHAFVFAALTLFELLGLIHGGWTIAVVRLLILLALFVYLGAALRRVYGGSRWLTAAKTAGIVTIYLGFVLIAMAIIALVTLRRL